VTSKSAGVTPTIVMLSPAPKVLTWVQGSDDEARSSTTNVPVLVAPIRKMALEPSAAVEPSRTVVPLIKGSGGGVVALTLLDDASMVSLVTGGVLGSVLTGGVLASVLTGGVLGSVLTGGVLASVLTGGVLGSVLTGGVLVSVLTGGVLVSVLTGGVLVSMTAAGAGAV
jgi:hypothetical protein